ncbi:DUF3577 domain-containing protein [Vibrio sp. 10N.261.46.A3]|uniref:DUF3577 domain-containing protein n=1 Tax=Vibrio sp. 10N.261.46.A3 TaxID=3229658 RepID=UPI00354D0487
MSQANQDSQKALNLHTKGIGYLNRIRKVTPKKGQPFWSVEVNCHYGTDKDSTRFDCIVVGKDAIDLFDKHLVGMTKEDTVTASVLISDIYLHQYIYTKGPKTGEPGACIKGRLLEVKYLKVNGQVVHSTKLQATNTHAA